MFGVVNKGGGRRPVGTAQQVVSSLTASVDVDGEKVSTNKGA